MSPTTIAGQDAYYYYFGTRLANKHYPVEMYSNKSPRVFMFEINSPSVVTTKGIRVGSTEAQLRRAYALTRRAATASYYIYSSGGMQNRTEFYVSRSTKKVIRVLISRN